MPIVCFVAIITHSSSSSFLRPKAFIFYFIWRYILDWHKLWHVPKKEMEKTKNKQKLNNKNIALKWNEQWVMIIKSANICSTKVCTHTSSDHCLYIHWLCVCACARTKINFSNCENVWVKMHFLNNLCVWQRVLFILVESITCMFLHMITWKWA